MTEEERAAFRSFLLRRYVLSILALVPEREGEMTVEDKDEMASAAAEHGRSRKKRKGKN